MALLKHDPSTWPIITNVYRYISTCWNDSVIYNTCLYEDVEGFTLVRIETDHYCTRCGVSVSGGYGVITYTRVGRSTIPMYRCVGCYPTSSDPKLTWGWESAQILLNKVTAATRDSPGLLATLTEIRTTVLLRGPSVDFPPEFTRLMCFARKL